MIVIKESNKKTQIFYHLLTILLATSVFAYCLANRIIDLESNFISYKITNKLLTATPTLAEHTGRSRFVIVFKNEI